MSEVLGIGCDLCSISRMEQPLKSPSFMRRCLTEEEQAYLAGRGAMAAASLAGMWAAKEAALKALGVGISIPLTEVGVRHLPGGQPVYVLTGRALELVGEGRLSLSISHEGDMALAFCVWSGKS